MVCKTMSTILYTRKGKNKICVNESDFKRIIKRLNTFAKFLDLPSPYEVKERKKKEHTTQGTPENTPTEQGTQPGGARKSRVVTQKQGTTQKARVRPGGFKK